MSDNNELNIQFMGQDVNQGLVDNGPGGYGPIPNNTVQTLAATRVMSPNTFGDYNVVPYGSNNNLIEDFQCQCQVCGNSICDPVLCGGCGTYGHPQCLKFQSVSDYGFCGHCFNFSQAQFHAMQSSQQLQVWKDGHANQVMSWKQKARIAVGISTSIGVAVGGAAAAAAGALVGVTQGFVQGMSGSSSGAQEVHQMSALPPVPDSFAPLSKG